MRKLKKLVKWGNSHVLILNKTDLRDFEFKEGDFIDISEIRKVIIKKDEEIKK